MHQSVYIEPRMQVAFFWLFFGIVFYTYLGYPAVLWLFSFFTRKKEVDLLLTPSVTVLIAAYNEEQVIHQKLVNSFALDYPPGQLTVMVVADGSTDATVEKVKEYNKAQLLFQPERKGKSAAINRAMPYINSEIVLLTDANCFLETGALKKMVACLKDDAVGGVSGAKKVNENLHSNSTGSGEGMYWKYESFLKKMESSFYTVVGAAGELFAFRRSLFVPIDETSLTDDFYLSLSINLQNKIIAYAPGAVGSEKASPTYNDEWKRKVRIAAGGFQSLILLPGALNVLKHPLLSFQFFSHRVLRWVACAPSLIFLFLLNAWMFISGTAIFYEFTFYIQLFIYSAATLGFFLPPNFLRVPLFNLPYYFVFMHAAMLAGAYRFLKGSQSVLWEKAARSVE